MCDCSHAPETHSLGDAMRLSSRDSGVILGVLRMAGGNSPRVPGHGLELCDYKSFMEELTLKISRVHKLVLLGSPCDQAESYMEGCLSPCLGTHDPL